MRPRHPDAPQSDPPPPRRRIVRVLHATEEIMHIEHDQKLQRVELRTKTLEAQLAEAHAEIKWLRTTAASTAAAAAAAGGKGAAPVAAAAPAGAGGKR